MPAEEVNMKQIKLWPYKLAHQSHGSPNLSNQCSKTWEQNQTRKHMSKTIFVSVVITVWAVAFLQWKVGGA